MSTYGPYPAIVTAVHDGDTFALDIDQGYGTHQTEIRCRVYGINAPELSTPEGKAAQVFAAGLLPVGCKISVLSHGWDKYGGRADMAVTLPDGTDFAQRMLDSGHAVPYKG